MLDAVMLDAVMLDAVMLAIKPHVITNITRP